MFLKGQHYVFMEGNPGVAGSGAGAAPGAQSDAGASGQGGAGPTGAGANGAAGAGAANSGSAMGAGAGADASGAASGGEGAGAGADPWAFIPEKFIVKNDKGEVDPQASAKKVEEHRSNLEKRLGEGGARPKTATEYKLPEVPEALKGVAFDDAITNKFKEDAHKAGFSQAQFEFAMGKYFELAPALVNGGQKVSAEDTIANLKQTWGAEYEKNGQAAWRGMNQIAQAAGLTPQEVEAELGNSPAFNRIMAVVGAQLQEDKSVNPGGSTPSAGGMAEAATLQASEAFRNTRHPEHAITVAKWNKLVTAGVPDTPIA